MIVRHISEEGTKGDGQEMVHDTLLAIQKKLYFEISSFRMNLVVWKVFQVMAKRLPFEDYE